MTMERRTFIKGLGAAVALAPGVSILSSSSARAAGANPHLTAIHSGFLIRSREARAWHAAKDSMGGPTLAGSPGWRNFLNTVEHELQSWGLADVFRNPWTYTRWSTTEWPDDSGWSLHLGERKVRVASYGCNSGKTPEEGVTAPLVVYREGMAPEALAGRIAIVVKPSARDLLGGAGAPGGDAAEGIGAAGGATAAAPAAAAGDDGVRRGDYEYLSTPESFPDPLVPRAESAPLSPFPQMGLREEQAALEAGGAVGALLVLGLSYDALAGTYTFPVPPLHDLPTLYLDREAGAEMIAAAAAGRSATLRLLSSTEEAQTYQLFGYLPGRSYKTPEDEQILLITHTDGPSISQDNGAFGILGMVRYLSRIPQAERPRTLLVFLDCRHYMPGAERAFAAQDWAAGHPEIYDKVVAAMGIEHLGQIQPGEGDGSGYHPTDKAELSTVWTTENQQLVDWAIAAIEANRLERVQVQCPGRPGKHGGEQGPWYGLGNIARRIGVPGVATMGSMTAYWTTKARLPWLDADHFVAQVATMTQICGQLMLADLQKIESAPGAAEPAPPPI